MPLLSQLVLFTSLLSLLCLSTALPAFLIFLLLARHPSDYFTFFTGLRISLLPDLFINHVCLGMCWKWWNDFLIACSKWCCINADFVIAVVETFLTNWMSLRTEYLVATGIVLPLPLWKLEAGSWLTQVLTHLSVQRNGCKDHKFDWIGLFGNFCLCHFYPLTPDNFILLILRF